MSASQTIGAWLLVAINSWGQAPIPPSQAAHVAEVHQRVAESVVAVAYDPDEAPISTGPIARARTALLLTSIFALETRFQERVITGHCIKPECDNGAAWGLPQLHVGRYGFRLAGDGFAYCFVRAADCYSVNELVDDWGLQVKAATHLYRTQGPRAWPTYPAAALQAKRWMEKNPPPVEDAQAMGRQVL